jgi:hypothetical protein
MGSAQTTSWLDHLTTWFAAWRDPFTTWLDHWQTLAAGLIAIVAALIAVGVPEFFARRRARREVEAMRVALAVEARRLMDTMIEAHSVLVKMLKIREESAIRSAGFIPAAEQERARAGEASVRSIGRKLGGSRKPVVYPACADRIGSLGRRLAEGVAGFYANYEHLRFLGRVIFDDPHEVPASRELTPCVVVFEEACAKALPLFEELPIKGMREPFDLRDLKAKVEGMTKARTTPDGG